MWWGDSGADCFLIDSSRSEEIMFVYSPEAVRAETRYRQDRIRREFLRPFWFQRRRKPEPPRPCAPELRARPAM
ncbi:hypothetical protein GCM10009804_60350 [Kribbella hippodromi]|uniref:Uncharacterized protein n=1 Tax=Kribbella hippodromi TaxID=434347 RepID=A0ABN2E5D0_9ACTN